MKLGGSRGRATNSGVGARSFLIVGTVPPPLGGVANVTWRLVHELAGRGHACELLDLHPGRGKAALPPDVRAWTLSGAQLGAYPLFLLPRLRLGPWDVIHWNFSSVETLRYFGPLLRLADRPGRSQFLTLHHGDQRRKLAGLSRVERRLAVMCMRGFSGLLALSEEQLDFYASLGLGNALAVDGYVPPPSVAADPAPAAATQARRQLLVSGQPSPVYGYDLALRLIDVLGEELDLGLVLCLYGRRSSASYEEWVLREALRRPRVQVMRDLDFPRFARVMAQSQVYLRLTTTDSTGLAVRDGLAMGIPVVASDSVTRPAGVYLYAERDFDDLVATIRGVLGVGPARAVAPPAPFPSPVGLVDFLTRRDLGPQPQVPSAPDGGGMGL